MGFITCKRPRPTLPYSGLKHPHSRHFCAQDIQLLSHQFLPPVANALLIHLICFPDKKCHINEMWGFHGSIYQNYGHLAHYTMSILQHIPLQCRYRFIIQYGITSQQYIITILMLNQYNMFLTAILLKADSFSTNFTHLYGMASILIITMIPESLSIDQ
jgi:hypothetical protein